MKIKCILPLVFVIGVVNQALAQVEDVSFFVTPSAGYNWFDDKSTIEDGVMYGVAAGFGFGKNVELRAIYEQSANLDQDFSHYSKGMIIPDLSENLMAYDLDVTRIGGEFKLNIPIGTFSPYILIGTGVQKIERQVTNSDAIKNENLYGLGGIGFKTNLTTRLTFNIEGRVLGYNMSPVSLLGNPNTTSPNPNFQSWLSSQEKSEMLDWAVNVGLQIYLGGTNDKDFTTMDRAYWKKFGSGLANFKVTLAPGGAYINFDGDSGYRNTYLLGGTLGVQFTDYVGLQAYYYHATQNEEISFDFDKLAMYGVDFVGRLNVARGIVPYLTVGGGYLNVSDNYVGKTSASTTPSRFYAKGGLGLSIPLGKRVEIFGAANLLYTTEDADADVTNISGTDELRNHTMYNLGLRIKLSKKIETESVVDKTFNQRFTPERQQYEGQIADYTQQLEERDQRIKAYEQQIDSLSGELKEAFAKNDEVKALGVMREKQRLEDSIAHEQQQIKVAQNTLVKMTPEELQALIDETLKAVEEEQSQSEIETRLDRIEQLLELQMRSSRSMDSQAETPRSSRSINQAPAVTTPEATTPSQSSAASAQSTSTNQSTHDLLIQKISELQQKLNTQEAKMELMQANQNSGNNNTEDELTRLRNENIRLQHNTLVDNSTNRSAVAYNFNKGMGMYIGANFGEASTFNIGARWYTAFSNSALMFMPEAYIAVGEDVGFGLSANGVLPITINSRFTPYLGVGVGVHYLNKEFSFNPNFIGGVSYKLGTANSVFFDYTVRGGFKNNQLALGYRFRF